MTNVLFVIVKIIKKINKTYKLLQNKIKLKNNKKHKNRIKQKNKK